MPTYRVTWEVDVEADSPREAAVKAMQVQHPHTTANFFSVRLSGDVRADVWSVDFGAVPRAQIVRQLQQRKEGGR